MAIPPRTATLITILQELGDDDFKQFKWHLSEYKHIPYFQLEHSDRVDTSIKIKKTYGAERGLMFIMDLLKEMNMNDIVSRFSNTVSSDSPPQTREAVTTVKMKERLQGEEQQQSPVMVEERLQGEEQQAPDIPKQTEWRPSPEAAFPEEMRAARLEMHSLLGGGLICAIMGSILLVVSTVTDNWLARKRPGLFLTQGLWKACEVHNNDICYSIFAYFPHVASPFQATGAFMILACIACFIGIIVGIKAFAPVSPFRRYNRSLAAASLFFFSSFTVLMVIAIYTAVTFKNFKEWDPKHWYFSWSYKIGWAALIMILVAGSLYSWTYVMHEKEFKEKKE